MNIVSNKDNTALIYINNHATSSFWDEVWFKNNDWVENIIKKVSSKNRTIVLIKKYTPPGGNVLEGGSGMGQIVYGLSKENYTVVGIDYAKNTVDELNEKLPELDIRYSDIRNLSGIKSEIFDTCYSGGVIEHFWEGYEGVLSEMIRVLKPNGILITTFPYMSKARKKFIKKLPIYKNSQEPAGFYQFALEHNTVVKKLPQKGLN